MAKRKIAQADIEAMKSATLACWWPSRAFPKEAPCWSGIRNELEALAHDAEAYRDDAIEAAKYSRLATIAQEQIWLVSATFTPHHTHAA